MIHSTWESEWPLEVTEFVVVVVVVVFCLAGRLVGFVDSYLLDEGSNSDPLQWKCRLNHWSPREVPYFFFISLPQL